MILSRNALVLGALIASAAGPSARAGDVSDGIVQIGNRCASIYGPGYVDMRDGSCGVVSGHVRVQLNSRAAGGWDTDGTSTAAMRTGAPGMLPGVGDTQHLRVRSGLDPYSPFR